MGIFLTLYLYIKRYYTDKYIYVTYILIHLFFCIMMHYIYIYIRKILKLYCRGVCKKAQCYCYVSEYLIFINHESVGRFTTQICREGIIQKWLIIRLGTARREFRRHYNLVRHGRVSSCNAITAWAENFEKMGSTLKKHQELNELNESLRTFSSLKRVQDVLLENMYQH